MAAESDPRELPRRGVTSHSRAGFAVPNHRDSGHAPRDSVKLSLVFVNYNLPELLREALNSLAANMPAFPIEIIVVDNASRDQFPREWAVPYPLPEIRWIYNRANRGYGPAANQGIAIARGDYVAIAGTDIEFLPAALEQIVEFLDRHPEAGAVSPQLLWSDRTSQPTARRYPSFRYLLSGRRSPLSRLLPNQSRAREFVYAGIENSPGPVEVEAVIGAFLVAPGKLLRELGGFDEQFFFYVEDMDFCRRVHEAGKRVYLLPQALMIHHLGPSRRKCGSFAEFQRLRSFYRYFRMLYFRLPAGLFLFFFSCYLALIAGGGVLGIREWEYPTGIGRRPRIKDQGSKIKDQRPKTKDQSPESSVLGLSDQGTPTAEDRVQR